MKANTWKAMLLLPVIAGGLMVAGLVHMEATTTVDAAGQPASFDRDFGSWKFEAMQDPGSSNNRVQIAIAYPYTTLSGLRGFAQANKDLVQQLKSAKTQQVESLITFNSPVSLDDFASFVASNKLTVTSYTIRMTAPDGTRWTVSGAPQGGTLIPQEQLATEQRFVQEHAQGAVLNGVVDVEASFDIAQYESLQSSGKVFLVDVTRTLAAKETARHWASGGKQKTSVDEPHPYWYMENLGLQNFR